MTNKNHKEDYISKSHLTNTSDNSIKKPDWIRVKAPISNGYLTTKDLINKAKLNTVCESASCPNIGECWDKGHATVMILGDVCTRKCGFCNIKSGNPNAVDTLEPKRLAIAMQLEATEMDLFNTVFPHPTISESIHESVLDAYDRAIHI